MAQAPQGGDQQVPGAKGNFFSSVMDHFRTPAPGGGNTVTPGGGGQQPGNGQQQQNMMDPNNPLLPSGQGGGQQEDKNKSPMAEFANLWDNPAPKAGEQPQVDWNDPSSIVPAQTLDPAKIGEAAKKIDFSRVLNPETVKKALAGDAGAFGEALNSVAQAAFSNSALIASRIVDSSLRGMAPRLINDALPHHMKRHGIGEGFGAENPIFNDPAVKPMLEMVTRQFQQQNPKSSAKEIADKAKAYVLAFANAANGGGKGGTGGNGAPGAGGNNNQGAGQDMDWIEGFLEDGNSGSANKGPQL